MEYEYLQTTVWCSVKSYSTDIVIDVVRQSIIITKPVCKKSTKRITRGQIKNEFPEIGDQI